MTSPEPGRLYQALSAVIDPELRKPITELGMVDSVSADESGQVVVKILLTIAGCPLRDTITSDATSALSGVPGVSGVTVELGVMTPEQRGALRDQLRPDQGKIPFSQPDSLTRIYAVASGKGGVGKSSITVNLACALAARGLKVGIVDADIYGFSVPALLGLARTGPDGQRSIQQPTRVDEMILPPVAYDVKVISIGMFLSGNQPVAWRGPMLHRALEQFLADVYFGDLDVLLLDLPPGTGDIAISVSQLLPGSELLVVTTPQPAATDIAERAGTIATQTGQKVAGVIENMSWLEQPDGSRMELFGSGGGGGGGCFGVGGGGDRKKRPTTALGYETPLLGQIPLDISLRENGDAGTPLVHADPQAPAAQALKRIAGRLFIRPHSLAGKSLGIRPG